MDQRVQFFSNSDMSIPYELNKAEGIISKYENGDFPNDVNDYLELFNIYLFLENNIYPNDWTNERKKYIGSFMGIIASYFKSLTTENFPIVYKMCLYCYKKDFWDVVIRTKAFNGLNEATLVKSISNNPYDLHDILLNQQLVDKYDKILTKLFKSNVNSAEWLLSEYVNNDKLSPHKHLFFPKSLNLQDKENLLIEYLQRKDANLNYVRLILFVKNSNCLRVSDKTRLLAQKRERALNDEVLNNGSATQITYQVEYNNNSNTPIKDVKYSDDGQPILVYNSEDLLSFNPYELPAYCRYVFEYLNSLGFIQLVSKESDSGVMERIIGPNSKNAYKINMVFRFHENTSFLQINAIQNILQKNDKSLELGICEYYEKFLSERYNYPSQKINLIIETEQWLTKCRNLIPEIEAIAKQYSLYAEDGNIDFELLAIKAPMHITSIKSSIKKRYFNINEDCGELHRIMFLLFSDQCMLQYIDPFKDKHYNTFFELLKTETNIKYDIFKEYQKSDLHYLIEKGIISNHNGVIKIKKPYELIVLKQLYEYHSCPYWEYDSTSRAIVESMADKGWIVEYNYLLTKYEQDYFSYYLNNERFTNGPALRNKYAHGVNGNNNEKEHQHDYYRLLNLLILLLLKIESDLVAKEISNRVAD